MSKCSVGSCGCSAVPQPSGESSPTPSTRSYTASTARTAHRCRADPQQSGAPRRRDGTRPPFRPGRTLDVSDRPTRRLGRCRFASRRRVGTTHRCDRCPLRTTLTIAGMDCPTEEALIRTRSPACPEWRRWTSTSMQRRLSVTHRPGRWTRSRRPECHWSRSEGRNGDTENAVPPTKPCTEDPLVADGWPGNHRDAGRGYWLNGGDHWTVLALALVSILSGGLATHKKAGSRLRHRNLNINALMSIAVTGAMLIGHWPEAAMVMFLFTLAEMIEAKSLDRARNAIRGLLELTPDTATVCRQGDGSW